MLKRCQWCLGEQISIDYHDNEWGIPVHDDQLLFEFLTLEGAQAGLSWLTILKRRDEYEKAFANFDIVKVSRMNQKDIEYIIKNRGVIKNKLKIASVINNAQIILNIQKTQSSFNDYLWQFVDFKTINHSYKDGQEIKSTDEASINMSRELKKQGFKFIGPTICYALMQATGMVNDHSVDCFRYSDLNNTIE